MEEKEAIRKLKEGDKKAFEYLYKSYLSKVYNFIGLYIVSSSDIEEIVQEVFIKLWDARESLNEDKNFNGFLFIITRNLIFNQTRKSFNESFFKQTILNSLHESYSIENELEASDLNHYIDHLLSMLPSRQQEIFRLSRKEQLSYKEIASKLHVSEKVVEHSISNVLKFLKKNLKLYMVFVLA